MARFLNWIYGVGSEKEIYYINQLHVAYMKYEHRVGKLLYIV